jgi:UDP-N-acetylmuramyl pentapeptide phosphotransferase/UDP-N-acetylglucosamine-1-phosphate transferase
MPYILLISHRKHLFDLPDERKIHHIPVPRLGGLAFVPVITAALGLGFGLSFLFVPNMDGRFFGEFVFLFVGLMLLFFVGLCDDLIGVRYKIKFIAQLLVAALFPLSGLWVNSLGGLCGIHAIPAWIGIPVTLFIIVYITNAINLIDGIDGLASGLSCISLVIMGFLAFLSDQINFVFLATATFGVLILFLYYNIAGSAVKFTKLFMGDTGSLTLGYILSFFVIHFCRYSTDFDPFDKKFHIVAISTLLIPLFDVVRVVCSRMRDKRHLFKPDKNHIHHKFLRTGLSPKRTMMSILLISLIFVLFNYFLGNYISITLLFFGDVILWFCMHFILNHYIWKREKTFKKQWVREYK